MLQFCYLYVLQVKLLKDILEAWKKEVEKKPPSMSIDDAYDVLNLKKGVGGYVLNLDKTLNKKTFLARLHFSAEELLLYPRRQRPRQRPRRRPHAKC